MRATLLAVVLVLMGAVEARADAWVPIEHAQLDPVLRAADGTQVTVYSGATDRPALEIERPGAAPRRVYLSREWAQDIDVAVAPGGWVAAIWAEELGGRLGAAIIRPDGRMVRRDGLPARSVTSPKAAIDAKGHATFAWVGTDGLRTAGSSLRPTRVRRGVTAADVAVSPNGRRVLVWTTKTGVHARLDGGRERRLAKATKAEVPAVEVNARGDAVVAYRHRGGVGVVDRDARGWRPPRAVYKAFAVLPLTVVLSPRGRAAVAWVGDDAVHAVAGLAGGPWDTTTRLSTAVSSVSELTLRGSVDPAGTLSLVWSETFLGVHGAAFVPGGEPDTTPLAVEVGFPTTAPSTTDGVLSVSVTVRCSKTCDVDLRHGENVPNWLVRTLPAGQATTIELPINDLSLLFPRINGRMRLIVTAGDRVTGQVDKRSQPYVVQVARPPLSSFKVAADHDFGMGTPEGNRAVADLVNGLIDGFERGEIKDDSAFYARWKAGQKALENAGYAVSGHLMDQLLAVLKIPAALAGFTARAVIV
ncbi:hypothetical protein OJ997_18805 [Solirubrobacter phytolaccae]|uniref:Uncharacterized protein n=1 Tax=Solirubrobacter phytolaccae TaxID=1404360 RepID=A0A9X3N9C2_9ACTN|nr:hypothetical protein [Solirubrobacter phytolaccae]MDA0182365.1 hypothetical protein [Solirubrobacter phytolaccae]